MPVYYDIPKWGDHMNKPTYRLVPSQEFTSCRHSIGGKGWKYVNNMENNNTPTLLLSIDFNDPHFASFKSSGMDELPIAIFEDDVSTDIRTRYRVSNNKTIVFLGTSNQTSCLSDLAEKDIHSLEFIPCHIEPLPADQYCINEQNYWKACDNFLTCCDRDGDPSVIRILGEPVWLEYVTEEICECGNKMDYIVSVGYDVSDDSKFSSGDMFMFLEGGMYFFFCEHCCIVHMLTQSS